MFCLNKSLNCSYIIHINHLHISLFCAFFLTDDAWILLENYLWVIHPFVTLYRIVVRYFNIELVIQQFKNTMAMKMKILKIQEEIWIFLLLIDVYDSFVFTVILSLTSHIREYITNHLQINKYKSAAWIYVYRIKNWWCTCTIHSLFM